MTGAWARLAAYAGDISGEPVETLQERWFRSWVGRTSGTAAGAFHGWTPGMSREAFRAATPLRDYEGWRPWVQRILGGESDVLFPGRPLVWDRTGGSEGGAKWVPFTSWGLEDLRRSVLPWVGRLVRDHGLREGGAFLVASPTEPGDLHGIPLGLSEAEFLGADAAAAFADLAILPSWISGVRDLQAWRHAVLHFLVLRGDMALCSLWSPTLLAGFLDDLANPSPGLLRSLHEGGQAEKWALPASPAACRRLEAFAQNGEAIALWPGLKVVSAWEDGASRPFAELLKARIPQAAFEGKGLLATEGVVTVPYAGGAPVLTPEGALYEFIGEEGAVAWAEEVEPSKVYEVALTTGSGLARYLTGDLVRCEGHVGGVPRLRFLGRRGLTSDLVGEKLTEAFVDQCLRGIPGFRMLLPHPIPSPFYWLVVDQPLAEEQVRDVEARLWENPGYAHACRRGQLMPLKVVHVPRAWARYEAGRLRAGQRPGVIKAPALCVDPGCLSWFTGEAES